ncbi:MAG: 30S ribosomal protein S4 [Eubacteriales bacterium]|nr:30S ribosomal protein S4 [Eubacteriales bacterium]
MATRRGPRFKECRRLAANVCGHPKAMNRAVSEERSRKKLSEYALQLREKQKIKAYYGIFEKQLRNYFAKAQRVRKGTTGEVLMCMLEKRLDNMVYRAGFANSIRMARQMVSHGHILVNGKRINLPSYQISVGDELKLTEKARSNSSFSDQFSDSLSSVPYLERDKENFSVRLAREPERSELPIEVKDRMVVEFYSR